MPQIKLSQLPLIDQVSSLDLCELSKYVSVGNYISSGATLEQVAQFVISRQTSQFGEISGSSFFGNPLLYEVNLIFPYPNTSYIINVTGENPRIWTIATKTTSSFIVSSNSNVSFDGFVYWRTESL